MKRLHLISVLALVAVMLAVTAGPGCRIRINTEGAAGKAAVVSDAALSTSLDSSSAPVDPSNTFPLTADRLYLSFKLNNAPANTRVTAKVIYLQGEAADMANKELFSGSLSGEGTKYMAFTVKPPAGIFPQGNYQATLTVNGKDTINLPFTMQNLSLQKGWPVISRFTVSPDSVPAGQPVTLSWEISDATRVTLQPEIGTVPSSGTRTVTPPATTTYKLIAANDAGSTTREVTVNVGAAVSGAGDLVVTDAWLEGCMVYYKIKNAGSLEIPGTTTYLYVDNLFPPMGGTSYCDVMKPGQERTLVFSSYQWPDCGQQPASSGEGRQQWGTMVPAPTGAGVSGYIDTSILNRQVRVCADGRNEAKESNKNNNCLTRIWGILLDYDMLPLAHLATWRNSAGEMPAFGSEGSATGAYIKLGDGGLEMVPQQAPQGWIQGYWGMFSVDPEFKTPVTAAIQLPPQTHLKLRVGLAGHAQGSDGVTFKVGMRDLSDTVNFLPGRKMTVPGQFEDWDIDLSDYEGQKVLIVLRVEAGATAANDFAIWKEARLMQVNQ